MGISLFHHGILIRLAPHGSFGRYTHFHSSLLPLKLGRSLAYATIYLSLFFFVFCFHSIVCCAIFLLHFMFHVTKAAAAFCWLRNPFRLKNGNSFENGKGSARSRLRATKWEKAQEKAKWMVEKQEQHRKKGNLICINLFHLIQKPYHEKCV